MNFPAHDFILNMDHWALACGGIWNGGIGGVAKEMY